VNREQAGRKWAMVAAVATVAFLCGWSGLGLVSGVMFAIALSASVYVALFSDREKGCALRLRRRSSDEPRS
jgi:hypothetical protein